MKNLKNKFEKLKLNEWKDNKYNIMIYYKLLKLFRNNNIYG